MARSRISRKTVRLIVLIAILLAIIAIAVGLFLNWQASRNLGFDLGSLTGNAQQVPTPQFLYSFAGPDKQQLKQPLGVLVDGDRVIVSDAYRKVVYTFKLDGTYLGVFGFGKVQTPLYIAKNPLTGDLWITDRATRSIHIFTKDGKYLRDFNPHLPKAQLPKFPTQGVQWQPLALAFAPDGTLYVTEMLNGHRLLIFSPQGKFLRSVGNAGQVDTMTQFPGLFFFPNSVKVIGKEVWVSDSNNRRIQVFNRKGDFERIVPTQGLPRGIAYFKFGSTPTAAAAVETTPTGYVTVVDTLAHDVTIWGADGKKALSFGTNGILDGQFNFPNDVSIDARNRVFIADTGNGRIQVWGWPSQLNPVPTPQTPWQWALCLSPLLLLLLPLLFRRKKFYTTPDFVQVMIAAGLVDQLPLHRRRWLVTEETHEMFVGMVVQDVDLGDMLESTPYSESDARAVMERLDITWPQAVDLTMAGHAKVFCTQDEDLRRLARILEIDVIDAEEFVRRYVTPRDTTTPPEGGAPGAGPAPGPGTGPEPSAGGIPQVPTTPTEPTPSYPAPPYDQTIPSQQPPVGPAGPGGDDPSQAPIQPPG
jgi:hypothetical protein